jgi:hypothetical protein
MSYVRRIISEQQTSGTIIRRYEVETPEAKGDWDMAWEAISLFDKLVVLDLYMDLRAADYFRSAPFILANEIWQSALTYTHDGGYLDPFWRLTTAVSFFSKPGLFYVLADDEREYRGAGPLPIAVELWDEAHSLYEDEYWMRRNQVWRPELQRWLRKGNVLSDADIALIHEQNAETERWREYQRELELVRKRNQASIGRCLLGDVANGSFLWELLEPLLSSTRQGI